MEVEHKLVCDLPNGAISNDLERTLTLLSRSRHSLTLNISQTPTDTAIVTIHCVPRKHVTTFLMISWSRTVRLERFLAHLLLRVRAIDRCFYFSHLTYFVQLLCLGNLSRPKYQQKLNKVIKIHRKMWFWLKIFICQSSMVHEGCWGNCPTRVGNLEASTVCWREATRRVQFRAVWHGFKKPKKSEFRFFIK